MRELDGASPVTEVKLRGPEIIVENGGEVAGLHLEDELVCLLHILVTEINQLLNIRRW